MDDEEVEERNASMDEHLVVVDTNQEDTNLH